MNEYSVNTLIAFLGVTAAIAFTNFNTEHVGVRNTKNRMDFKGKLKQNYK